MPGVPGSLSVCKREQWISLPVLFDKLVNVASRLWAEWVKSLRRLTTFSSSAGSLQKYQYSDKTHKIAEFGSFHVVKCYFQHYKHSKAPLTIFDKIAQQLQPP